MPVPLRLAARASPHSRQYDGSVSEHPRRPWTSRLHPTNWPPGTGTVLFVVWLGYAALCTVWVHALLWTVLPIGLTLYLFAAWYPWRVILILVVPVVLLTGYSQVIAASPDTPIWAAFAIYLAACGYFSFIVSYDKRDGLIARLPSWILGQRFSTRLTWARFEDAAVAANAVVRQVGAGGDASGKAATLHGLATAARREARRGGVWQEAWTAQAAWLDGLEELVATQPTADARRRVNDLLEAMNGAHMAAVERASAIDAVDA